MLYAVTKTGTRSWTCWDSSLTFSSLMLLEPNRAEPRVPLVLHLEWSGEVFS